MAKSRVGRTNAQGLHFGFHTKVKFVYGDLHIDIAGTDTSPRYFEDLLKKGQDLTVPFEDFQSVWFESIDQVFADGGDPEVWPDLSPAYANWKENHSGQPIMRLSDRLYDSLTSQTGDTIWQVGPRHIEFGTKVPYFDAHQEGRGRMPQRATLVLTDEAADRLMEIVGDYAEGKDEY